MFENTLFYLNLQLFADGGAGGTGGDGATGATATAAVSQKGVKGNPLADVVYGKQESAQNADVQTTDEDGTTTQTVDRNAEFEKLIRGEYKDLYDARVQDTIQKRLKGTKETVEKYEALSPTLEMLCKKYGVKDGDIAALNKAIEEDDAYYEQEAMDKGVSVESLKQLRKMQRENAELKQQMQQHNAEKLYASWMEQAEAMKSVYPSFDLRTEMNNPKFQSLLRNNVDVRTAFEVIHKDEIMPAAMQYTAKAVEQKITNKIIANGARPAENGISSQGASVTKSDVSQLTKADMAEIQRRVARGERISFG
jgi:hypothetical protein